MKQNRKTSQILLQVSQLGNYSLDQVTQMVLIHNWRESGYIILQSSCEHFPLKQVILYILFI